MSATYQRRQQAPPSSYYNNDDSDDLNSDEEEEERHLSELHGEAADEGSGKKRKRNNNDTTKLTEEDAAAAKEFEEKIRKKLNRPQFTPQLLTTGSKGLVYLRRSFPARVAKFRTMDTKKLNSSSSSMDKRQQELYKKRQLSSEINMAARYSSSLINAYTDFARFLFPSLAPADVFLKIEDMGSKKEIKDFLQVMRDDVRKEYLIKVYNGDVGKVERLLNELEYGLNVGGTGANALMGGGDGAYHEGGRDVEYDDGPAAPRLGIRADAEEVTAPAFPAVARAPVSNPYKKSVKQSLGNTEASESCPPAMEMEFDNDEKEEEHENVYASNEEDVEVELEFTSPSLGKGVKEGAANNNIEYDRHIVEAGSKIIDEAAVDNTQDTLTLLESQDVDDKEMDEDAHVACAPQNDPEQEDDEDGNDERFSQVNASEEQDLDATQDERQEGNAEDERFSQVSFEAGSLFTHGNTDDVIVKDIQENSAPLGQMTSTQLSMEY